MLRKIKIRKVERQHAAEFLRKANDFAHAMKLASASGNWNMAGLAAVHCIISAADAVLVQFAALRSASDNHEDTAELLKQHVRREGALTAIKHFKSVMSAKTDIEYSEHEVMEERATELVKHAERFFAWADDLLK